MSDYDKLLELTGSQEVESGVNLPKITLHKWLVLGQTEYLCKYGTLSDGHEKFTPAQKYAQAFKEAYYISMNMQTQRAQGMEAQADILDCEERAKTCTTESEKLRNSARLLKAKTSLLSALTNVEDQMRMLKFYFKTIAELKPVVETLYPEGIEQAEVDNWKTVAEYRMLKEKNPLTVRERLDNIPLPAEVKAKLGVHYDRIDAIAPLLLENMEITTKSASLTEAIDKIINKQEQLSYKENQ